MPTMTMMMAMVMVVVIDMMMRMVSEHSDEGIEPGLDLLPTRANDIIQEVDIYCCRVTGKIVKHTSDAVRPQTIPATLAIVSPCRMK